MGVVSNGMLCSGDELRLTADGDGILILPADAPLGVAAGRPLRRRRSWTWTSSRTEATPCRSWGWHARSRRPPARQSARRTRRVAEAGRPIADRLGVEVEDPGLCPRFVGRWVAGVPWGRRRTGSRCASSPRACGRSATSWTRRNYVMLELGKPIHTFDARRRPRWAGSSSASPRPGERLETLDHVERDLDAETLLIADPGGPARRSPGSWAARTPKSRTRPATSSSSRPSSTRSASAGPAFRYALRSEASLRFEKGQEHRLARIGADRTAQLVAEWAGGTVAPGAVDTNPASRLAPRRLPAGPREPPPRHGPHPRRAAGAPGARRAGDRAGSPRRRRRRRSRPRDQPLVVPARRGRGAGCGRADWRRDLAIEADIIEEIARVRGYDLVPGRLPSTPMPRIPPVSAGAARRRPRVARRRRTRRGRHARARSPRRCRTRRLGHAARSRRRRDACGRRTRSTVTNPLSADHSVLRQSLLGSLLDVVSTNLRRGRADVAVFEVGKGYGRVGDETARVVAPRARPLRSVRRAGLEPTVPRRATSTTRRGCSSSWPATSASARRPTSRSPASRSSIRAAPRRDRAAMRPADGPRRSRRRAAPGTRRAWELRTGRVVVAEISIAGLTAGTLRGPGRRRAVPTPARGARPRGRRGRGCPSGELASDHPRARRPTPRRRPPVRRLPRCSARLRTSAASPSASASPPTERTLTEAEIDGAMAAVMARSSAPGAGSGPDRPGARCGACHPPGRRRVGVRVYRCACRGRRPLLVLRRDWAPPRRSPIAGR